MKLIGLLIIANSIVLSGWWITNNQESHKSVIALCTLCSFIGLILILNERITEITVKGVGTIKAISEQAKLDAQTITDLKNRIQGQSETIDLVAGYAKNAKEISDEVAQKNKIVEETIGKLNEVVGAAQKRLDYITMLTDFQSTVLAAQNDNRRAFDQLRKWADDRSYTFSAMAAKAYEKICLEHSKSFWESGFNIPWNNGIDPGKLKLEEIRKVYLTAPDVLKPGLIEYVDNRSDFSKKEKLAFFIEIVKNDTSLRAVEYAGRYFIKGTSLRATPLSLEVMIDWWEKNKDEL